MKSIVLFFGIKIFLPNQSLSDDRSGAVGALHDGIVQCVNNNETLIALHVEFINLDKTRLPTLS